MDSITPIPNVIPPLPIPLPAADQPNEVAPEALMPYGEAAKAIFVKANGLPAYRKSIKFVRRAD
ncbi:MAG: hypothetical protein HZA62_09390 [Rhodocyclales bacterium]|nr:hypothetical protein [Rhodocyclales bacterium]